MHDIHKRCLIQNTHKFISAIAEAVFNILIYFLDVFWILLTLPEVIELLALGLVLLGPMLLLADTAAVACRLAALAILELHFHACVREDAAIPTVFLGRSLGRSLRWVGHEVCAA